jgi:hypothetical protein
LIRGLANQVRGPLRAVAADETRERLKIHNDLVAAIRQRDSAAIMQVMQRERCSALP